MPTVLRARFDEMEARGVGNARERAEDDRLDPGEDRGVDADADA